MDKETAFIVNDNNDTIERFILGKPGLGKSSAGIMKATKLLNDGRSIKSRGISVQKISR